MPRHRALLIGWLGSTPRHLRPLARHLEARGADVSVRVPDTLRAMATPGGWARQGRAIAAQLAEAHAADPRPWFLHASSNAGFWSAAALFDALDPSVRAAHRGSILDSAPGFPDRVSPRFTARFAGRAMLPGLLAALGQPPAHTHRWLTPPVSALLGAWHVLAPRQVRFMESSLARMRAAHTDAPLLLLHGDADALVLPEYVEAFHRACLAEGLRAERVTVPGATHVRLLVAHRAGYLEAVDGFVRRALPPG